MKLAHFLAQIIKFLSEKIFLKKVTPSPRNPASTTSLTVKESKNYLENLICDLKLY